MIKTIILTSAAHHDVEEIRAWYQQISPRLAADFSTELDALFQQILHRPESYPLFYQTYRRAVMNRFRYVLFFRIKDDIAIISMVMHQKRNPINWQKRLH